ncbi:MAG TPA: hypothetical protein DCR14_01480 [Acidimicrobiaceae bacterium]|nr:hypothetical protein [Acidimicrobiaceae bacterium]
MTSGWRRASTTRAGIALLAAIAYLPALLTKPGRMPSDTKVFLYLDPGRLIGDAPFTWDTRQFGGWVPHQVIAYLWPQGPWYWFFDLIGVPDWVAHRLWIGTLLFLGAWGVAWCGRLLGLDRSGALTAAVVYQLSPYVLPYISRTSAMLLPWAALGWIVGLTIKSARAEQRRWRHPALLALVLLSCSAVNATAVLMIAPAPLLWLAHAVWAREIAWRRATGAALRIGVLASGVSLWWIAMLRAQGTYGADVLAYSESLEATSFTSASTEVLRGAGYWLFYVRDPYAFTTTASQPYMESGLAIALSYALVLVCLAGLVAVRWAQRRFAALLVAAGVVLAVGVHPIWAPSPLMQPLADNSRSALSLAIRSSTRAIPMVVLGLALGAGALIGALSATRSRTRAVAPALVMALAVLNMPVLFNGGLVDPALERDEDPPAAWLDAAAVLDAGSAEYRVLQLPGAEFGAFRWGYTVDPPLPGITAKPLITRDLLPLGSPGVMDLLYALDDRVQQGTLDPAALAPIARLLGVDTIWLTNDQAYDRFRTPEPALLDAWMRTVPGLSDAQAFGEPTVNLPDIPLVDEAALQQAAGAAIPPVVLYSVDQPVAIVRVSTHTVVLVGSGDGVVDAAAAGLLSGDEAVLYAADLQGVAPSPVHVLVITDSNRDRAHHWRSSQDVTGYTEVGGDEPGVLWPDDADQRLPVFGESPLADAQTTAALDSGLVVRATGYGEPFAYRPEDRPAMAVDGDPSTAWVVADRNDPLGHAIEISDNDGTLRLLQPNNPAATRVISSVRLISLEPGSEWTADVQLGGESLESPGQSIEVPTGALRIVITGVTERAGTDTGPSAVGFAELGVGTHTEVVRLPTVERELVAADVPIAVVLTRERVDPLDRWRTDPEQRLVRSVDMPRDISAELSVVVRLDRRADDASLNAVLGDDGAVASARLTGSLESRGVYATDGDPLTAWTSPFGPAAGVTLSVPSNGEMVESFTLQQPVDDLHSRITAVRVQGDRGESVDVVVGPPDAEGVSLVTLPAPIAADTLHITVTDTEPSLTIDRRFAEATELPVAISEVGGTWVQPSRFGPPPTEGCRTDLVSVDGDAIGIELDAEAMATLEAGGAATVHPCDAATIDLARGTHRVESHRQSATTLLVDQVVLAEPAAMSATHPTGEADEQPVATVTDRSRTERRVTVSACPDGCWLVFGEGWNAAWTASVEGQEASALGAPMQISGGFNGWWLPPSATERTVVVTWTAQRPVTLAIYASILAVLVCVGLAVGRRRRWSATPTAASHDDPPRFSRSVLAPTSRRTAVVAALAMMALTALLISPRTPLLLATVMAVAVAVTRRPRLAGAVAWLGMGLIAALIVVHQRLERYPADAAWPSRWDNLHRPGLLVVVLLLVSCIGDKSQADGDRRT